jgi:hypothetical protein
MKKAKAMLLYGGALWLASEGAKYLFYVTDNMLFNLLTLLVLLFVASYVISEVIRICNPVQFFQQKKKQ